MALNKGNQVLVNDGGSGPIFNPYDGSIVDSFRDAVEDTIKRADEKYGQNTGATFVTIGPDDFDENGNFTKDINASDQRVSPDGPSLTESVIDNTIHAHENDRSIIDSFVDGWTGVNEASGFNKLKGDSVEDQLLWLIDHDPDNATGWMESLIGLRAERENVQSARDWEKAMADTRYQRTAKDLEAAGINPILAYQYVNGSASNVGTASYQSGYSASMAETSMNNKTKAVLGIVSSLIAAMALIGKFMK